MFHQFSNHEAWEATEREAVYRGTVTLLYSAYGPLDFSNVRIGGRYVEMYREDVLSDTFKFQVRMNVGDDETTGTIKSKNVVNVFYDSCFGTVCYVIDDPVL
jgi:hypothetical protein